jgi:hypothetical protein
MSEIRRVATVLALLPLALLFAACGNNDETRPIEVLFYVDGLSGTRFAVDGIQAANGDHRLPGRTFEAPYFFVLENARHFGTGPGIRGCFRTFADESAPITVFLYFGTALQQRVVLQPGQCYGPGYDPQNPPDCDEFVNPCTVTADIDMREPEVRFEICTRTGDELCIDAPATGPANIAFSASIGDFDATNITTCVVEEAATSACTTPSIFYLEDPADRIQGIFTKLGGQNPDVNLQADVYVGGNLRTSETNDDDVVIDEEI